VDPLSPAGTASGFSKPKNQALEIANASFLLQFATARFLSGGGRYLFNYFKLLMSYQEIMFYFHSGLLLQDIEDSPESSRHIRELVHSLQSIDVESLTELPKNQLCGEHDLPCDHTNIFRSITGWCNNLLEPGKGKAFAVFKRLLPPIYNDGMNPPLIKMCTIMILFRLKRAPDFGPLRHSTSKCSSSFHRSAR
jgi:hypothetical protein